MNRDASWGEAARAMAREPSPSLLSSLAGQAALRRALESAQLDPDDEERRRRLQRALRRAAGREPGLLARISGGLSDPGAAAVIAAGVRPASPSRPARPSAAKPSPAKPSKPPKSPKPAKPAAAKPSSPQPAPPSAGAEPPPMTGAEAPPTAGADTPHAAPAAASDTATSGTGTSVTGILSATAEKAAVAGVPLELTVAILGAQSADGATGGRFTTDFPRGVNRLPLVVELTSTTVEIPSPRRPIVLLPDGTSERPVSVQVVPKKAGPASITVTLVRGGAWLASVKFAIRVSKATKKTTKDATKPKKASDARDSIPLVAVAGGGSTRGAATAATPAAAPGGSGAPGAGDAGPSLTLVLLRQADGFHCVVTGPAMIAADLPATSDDLGAAVAVVRTALVAMSHDAAYQAPSTSPMSRPRRATCRASPRRAPGCCARCSSAIGTLTRCRRGSETSCSRTFRRVISRAGSRSASRGIRSRGRRSTSIPRPVVRRSIRTCSSACPTSSKR